MFFKKKKIVPPEGMALLTTASDVFEADVIESNLNSSGIPVMKRHRGPGGYMTILLGNSTYGIDLFVPEDKLTEAQAILDSADEVRDEDILSDPSFNDENIKAANEEYLKKLDRRNIWMAALFIAAIALLVYLTITNM